MQTGFHSEKYRVTAPIGIEIQKLFHIHARSSQRRLLQKFTHKVDRILATARHERSAMGLLWRFSLLAAVTQVGRAVRIPVDITTQFVRLPVR
ncbi:hypothetical protein NDX98_08595 [Enterobacter roggenkampii]